MAEAPSPSGDFSDLDDLPSPSTDTSSTSSQDEQGESDADREWRESLQQLELLLTMVLVPYIGKYYGRKFAYWGERAPDKEYRGRMLTVLQLGAKPWNGTILWRSWSRIRSYLRAVVLWVLRRLMRHFEG